MKHFLTLLLILSSFGAIGKINNDSLKYKLDGYFSALTALKNFNGNVIISKHGQLSKENINKFETENYLSTIGDLYNFSQLILSGEVIKQSWAIKLFEQDSMLIQAGGRPGYRSYFYKNFKTDITFIFVSNYTDIPIQEATTNIISILESKPNEVSHKINRKAIQLPVETLKQYTGKFALEADLTQIITILLIDNKLFDVDTNGEKTELYPDSESTFFKSPTTKVGYIFTPNPQTNHYDLTIIFTGLKFKTKRIE